MVEAPMSSSRGLGCSKPAGIKGCTTHGNRPFVQKGSWYTMYHVCSVSSRFGATDSTTLNTHRPENRYLLSKELPNSKTNEFIYHGTYQ